MLCVVCNMREFGKVRCEGVLKWSQEDVMCGM